MCGFLFSNKIVDRSKFTSIAKTILRRGPDFQKYITRGNCSLYHSRLKIIDTKTRSNQPFTDKYKKHYLLFNGEIYNFKILKREFKLKCKTSSDTEVLFLLLKKLGIKKTLKHIEGMFSFIFYNLKTNMIFGARDHFGQKPFYYSYKEKNLNCSTNIKPLMKLSGLNKFSQNSLDFYLNSSGILPVDKTLYEDIFSLPAGQYLKYNNNTKKLTINQYFHPSYLVNEKIYYSLKKKNFLEIKDELQTKLKDAVKKCLISDVPTGTTLSGGIDSSLVTFFSKKINSNIKTFTGVSKGIEEIPNKVVPVIVKKLKIQKPEFIYHNPKKYIYKLYKIILHSYSPSRWGGGVPMSDICKFARKKKVKVLLSGDGADEICGGYKTFSDTNLNKKESFHKIISIKKNIKNKLTNDYLNYLRINRLNISKKLKFIKNKNEKKKQLLFLEDISIFLQTCTLPHSDEYSMYESLELRNPFLDLDLVKFIINLNSAYKSKTKQTNDNGKIIFKELAKFIFGEFINQKKEGTRNYALRISNLKYWNLSKFKVLKKFKINQNLMVDNKKLFKIINLEFLYNQITNNKNFSISSILSKKGYKYFYG